MTVCVCVENILTNPKLPECDLAVFPFCAVGQVDYSLEIDGKSDTFSSATHLSERIKGGVICACKTIHSSLISKSAMIADCGRMLAICDMNAVFSDEIYKAGSGLALYTLKGYKVGICIDNDIYFPETLRALTSCGASLIVVVCEQLIDSMLPTICRTYAYLFGVPFLLVAGRRSFFIDILGEVASSKANTCVYEGQLKNNYRLVTTRLKGVSKADDTP